MAELVRNEPNWVFQDPLNRPVTRQLRVWRTEPGRVVAIVTEQGPGMSVTNAARAVVEQLRQEHPDDITTVIEHYPTTGGTEDTFDEIVVSGGGDLTWRRVSPTELGDLVGDVRAHEPPPAPSLPQPEPMVSTAVELGPPPADDVVFHGHASEGPGEAVVTVETSDGAVVGLLKHLVKRSSGFSWGYEGSGPAELARCLLIAALGSDLTCVACAGTTVVGFNPDTSGDEPFDPSHHDPETAGRCTACEDGIALAPRLYQQFKREVVARWPQSSEWRITAGDITAWVRGPES